MNKKNDDEDLEMDRDTSAPKDKMKKRIPRTLNSNNDKSNDINNVANAPLNKENEIEEEEIGEEEEEEEDDIHDDENKKEENRKEEIINNSSKNNSIENNKNSVTSKNEEIKEDQNNKELKINVNLKKDENCASCQVNLINNKEYEKIIQELKLKINTLENEKEMLISQLKENQKKYEDKFAKQNKDINSLLLLNNKLKKNLEKVNAQVTKLLNQVVANNSIPVTSNNSKMVTKAEKIKSLDTNKNKGEKEPNEEIKTLKEKLKLKESQIKEAFKTIEFLKKQNKKLKEDYDSITSDGKNINQNNKLVEEIKKKNNEIRELEKEYRNIISFKSQDEQIEYYKKLANDLTTQNDENKAKVIQLKQIVDKYQKKEMENKKNANLNNSILSQTKQNQEKIAKLQIKKGIKYEFIEFNNKKYPMNKNFSLLFNDLEKKTLFSLFPDEGDFIRFNQKLDIIENNFNSTAKRFQTNINELKETIDDNKELIAYFREKIRENEMKIKILLNQIHLERNKNEKRVNNQQQDSNDKNIINDTRAKSPKK